MAGILKKDDVLGKNVNITALWQESSVTNNVLGKKRKYYKLKYIVLDDNK